MPKITREQLRSLDRDGLEEFTEFLLQQNEELEGIQEQWLVKEQELKNLNKFRREKANLEAEVKKLEREKVETESQKREWEVERRKLINKKRKLLAEKDKVDLELEGVTKENIEVLAKNKILKEENKKFQKEIRFNKKLQKSDQKLIEELNVKNENLEKILLRERAVWGKKEVAGVNAVKEIVGKYNELLAIDKELKKGSQELAKHYDEKLRELADLQEENNALQIEIDRHLLISDSDLEVKNPTFNEELVKVSELETVQLRNVELERQLEEKRQNLDEVRKEDEVAKEKLTQDLTRFLEEVKQLKRKLQEKNDAFGAQQKKLEAAQIQQKILNKKLEESEWILQKVQSEKGQEIDNLKLNFVLLNQRSQEAEGVWQVKVSEINDKLREAQVKLGNLLGNQEEEIRAKEELYQEARILKKGLKASQLNEESLNEQIFQLKSEIIVVNEKLEEVKNERDNNSSLLLHYQTRISSLEKEKKSLLDEYEKLTKFYNQSKQEAKELVEQIKILEKSSEQKIIFNKESAQKENAKLQEEIVRLEEELKTKRFEIENPTKFLDKVAELEKQIKNLTWISQETKQQLIDELTKVKQKLAEKEHKIAELEGREEELKRVKVKELGETLKKATSNLTSRLNFVLWDQQRKKAFINKIKIKVEKKNQRLKTLSNRLVMFQSQLDVANSVIFEQNEKLVQKNQQLTDLLGQLEEKHKLVDDLQNEIKELESQKSSEISEKEKKIEQLEKGLKEKDEIIAMLKDKPPLVSEVGVLNAKSASLSSEKDLLGLIEYHRKEVQRLKKIIETQSRSTTLSEVGGEITLKETIQDLPKKNSSALYLSLLGGSLMAISLGLNLLKLKGKKV